MRFGRTLLLLAVLLPAAAATRLPAQGCSQCREQLGQTPARVQSAYRRGILVMVAAASTIFGATFLILRRFR